jgi:hypothetical protein
MLRIAAQDEGPTLGVTVFFISFPFPPRRRALGLAPCRLGLCSFLFSFRVPGSVAASEGPAPFLRSRTTGGDSVRPCRPRSLIAKRESGVRGSPGSWARDRGPEKTGRSIRRQATIRPLEKEPEPVSSQWTSGRAPALHALEYLTNPCLRYLSLRFRDCEADAAALRRAR